MLSVADAKPTAANGNLQQAPDLVVAKRYAVTSPLASGSVADNRPLLAEILVQAVYLR